MLNFTQPTIIGGGVAAVSRQASLSALKFCPVSVSRTASLLHLTKIESVTMDDVFVLAHPRKSLTRKDLADKPQQQANSELRHDPGLPCPGFCTPVTPGNYGFAPKLTSSMANTTRADDDPADKLSTAHANPCLFLYFTRT